jgi:type IV secretory pathway ATPase VirB11/archaellum biosynthesis ATPase
MIAAFIYLFMFREKRRVKSLYKFVTLEDLVSATSVYFRNRLHVPQRTAVSHEQLVNSIAEVQALKKTIEAARDGERSAREAIIDEIVTYLVSGAMNIQTLEDLSCIVFRDPRLMTENEKFETIMYFIGEEIKAEMSTDELYNEDNNALYMRFQEFIEFTQVFSHKRQLVTAPHLEGYYLNDDDMDSLFQYFLTDRELTITVQDAVRITAVIIYQKLFGYGAIDSLIHDDSIDEIELGTCGAEHGTARHKVSKQNSVMVSIHNELLRLQFLRFDTQSDFENCIISLSNPGEGSFTADDGYKFTTLKCLRRVTSSRPPLADSFTCNIRKLDVETRTNRQLLEWNKEAVSGTQFVEDTLQLLAWSLIPLAWTGEQGAGKTSHINAYVDLLEPDVAVRAIGNIDESQFGNRFPERDIKHLFETPRQSMHIVAGVGRRTKGKFLIMMEVIDSESGQEAINNFKSGYVGGMLSGHGDTPEAMVEFMGQLLAMGQSTSSVETTKIAASVLNINVKVMKYGNIFCFERISEVVPRSWTIDWNTVHEDSHDFDGMVNQQKFFENTLNPSLFSINDIVLFNKETNTYEPAHRPTLALCAKVFFRLARNRRKFLFNYMETYFGIDILQEMIDSGILIVDKERISNWL